MKVFLSHNMSGLSEEEVMEIRKTATEDVITMFGRGTDGKGIEIIDNYNHPEAPDNADRLWHLGRSIQQLAEADMVYFADKNSDSKGCQVEKIICELYGIPVVESF